MDSGSPLTFHCNRCTASRLTSPAAFISIQSAKRAHSLAPKSLHMSTVAGLNQARPVRRVRREIPGKPDRQAGSSHP